MGKHAHRSEDAIFAHGYRLDNFNYLIPTPLQIYRSAYACKLGLAHLVGECENA